MIGKTIFHYKILEKLGEGGMGVVYRAQDTKLDRTVALKFLPRLAGISETDKKRFVHEAKAAAALDHTNICSIHDLRETDDGQMFMVMPCYEGQNLKDKTSSHPLPVAEAVDIAIQIATGLQIAHEAHIIHRDIKSANIFITNRNEVKILDFGVAKLKGRTQLTREDSTLGTIDYMSPEQAEGTQVDHRTDIWSLGVILYEMITGQLPFKGDYEQAILYSIMSEEPEPVTGLRSGVSLELERIINKMMAKEAPERYQTAADLLVDLRKIKKESKSEVKSTKKELKQKASKKTSRKFIIAAGFIPAAIFIAGAILLIKGIPEKKSPEEVIKQVRKIAILPFVNMSADKDQEYFCDGISEELINRLAKISAFQVTARTSAFSFKGKNLDIPTIGKKLNVDAIVEGSVRWAGDKLRITAQLVKVSDGFHIWSETYDRRVEDVFVIQDEISLSIAQKLQVSLLEEEITELKSHPTDNLAAYNLYLRSNNYHINHPGEKGSRIAAQMVEKAIALDPDFALAYTRLSILYSWIYLFDKTDTTLAKAREAANKAFEIKPNLPEAHMALGFYYLWGYQDLNRAMDQLNIARKNLKNNAELFAGIGFILKRQGKWEQSIQNFKKALKINPLDHGLAGALGTTYIELRRYQEAEESLNLAISMAPDDLVYYGMKIDLYQFWHGDTEKAFQVLAEAPEAIHSWPSGSVVGLYLKNGNYEKALKQLSFYGPGARKDIWQAFIYGLMKQKEQAKKHYNSARKILEKKIKEENKRDWLPENHIGLGIVYAGLGRKEEAIREGKRAVEMAPITKNWSWHPFFLQGLAEIYVMVGEYDLAIDQLEFLLSIPSRMSVPHLRIDPTWNPIRNHPRFQKLLKGKDQ